MSVLPLYEAGQPFYAPAFEVKLTGANQLENLKGPATPLSRDVVKDALEVTFQDSVDKVDSFTLVFNNWDADARRPLFLGKEPTKDESDAGSKQSKKLFELIQPGNTLQLLMGYQGPRPDLRVMTTGVITTLEADFAEAAAPRLTVRGLNVLDRFRNKQYTWAWPLDPKATITDSEIAKDLAAKADAPPGKPGLGIEVRVDEHAAKAEQRLPYVMMNNQYPIVFLMDRARRNGYDLFLARDPKTNEQFLYFGRSDRIADRTYKLEWGKSLVSFKPTISLARQVSKVTVLGWDRKAKQSIKGEASLADVKELNGDLHPFIEMIGREEVVTDRPADTVAQAKQIAEDYLRAQVLDMVEATGVVVGLPDLRAGRVVEIGGLGDLLNGRWFVKETTHTLNDNGYRTTFVARREKAAT
jgi:phage protein D